ncbi:MAG TPA: CcmD family protein [Bacteroidetes bacterium]|nr:CcmD family protein [Bacteroidota bacterium]
MEEFLAEHQLYIVLGIVLLIWGGIVLYLLRLDKKLAELEKLIKKG